MKVTNEFLIPFVGLKLGKHQFEFQINKEFFEDYGYDEFESCDIKVNLVLEKKSTMLELHFKHKGTVHVPCDLTSEMFDLPVKGKISQRFNAKNHQAIDIVTPPDTYFAACLSGTVIYSGFSQKDGNILIIEHPNNYLSVYKHARTTLKKAGEKVRVGDVIGIVGNTGANTSGPHLHFELWLNQQAVDPMKYMEFE